MLRPVRRYGKGDGPEKPAAAAALGVVGKPQLERTFPPKFILEGRKWRVVSTFSVIRVSNMYLLSEFFNVNLICF